MKPEPARFYALYDPDGLLIHEVPLDPKKRTVLAASEVCYGCVWDDLRRLGYRVLPVEVSPVEKC